MCRGRQAENNEYVNIFREPLDQSERLGQAGTAFEQHFDTFRGCRGDYTTQHFGDPEVLLDVSGR